MNFDSTNYTFSIITFFAMLLFTFGLFYPLIKKMENQLKKYFLLSFSVSLFVYSGIGAAVLEDGGRYMFYYMTYCLVLVFSLYIFRNKNYRIVVDNEAINSFIEKKGNYIIFIYILFAFIQLISPENKLQLLLNPPAIDITGVMGNVTREDTVDPFTSIISLLKNIIFPLYFLSLIKFNKKPIFLLFIIIIPLYFSFCKEGYIARSVFGLYILFYMGILYFYHIKYRKIILTSTIILIVSSISFLAAFTYIRMGEQVNLSFSQSIEDLFYVEGTFPSWFENIYSNSLTGDNHIMDYLLWIITQPFPGFMKSWLVDFYLNISISKALLGLEPDEIVSYVPLVGLVSESVFVFGNKLYFLHAMILGYLLNLFSNLLLSREQFKIIMIYAIVFTCMGLGRAGTSGSDSYSFMIKTIVFLPLLLYLFNIKNT